MVVDVSNASNVDTILGQARERENEYDWLGVAESYKKVLSLLPEDDSSRKGEIHERLGYAFYRFAFQAESSDEFRHRLRQATANYEKAREFYQKPNEPKRTGMVLRCDAMIAYMGYWLTAEVHEKRRMLSECWRLTKEALKSFEEAGEASQHGRTYNQLSSSVVFGFCLEWNFQAREKLMREAVEHGEQAIKFLSTLEDTRELAKAYAKTAFCLGVFRYYFLDVNERENDSQKIQDYYKEAKELCEDVALFEFLPLFLEPKVFCGEMALKRLSPILIRS